jgi:hypothetical protein
MKSFFDQNEIAFRLLRKHIYKFLALSTLLTGIISCQKDSFEVNSIEKKVTNSEIINGFLSKVSTLKSSAGISYNTKDVYEMVLSGSSQKLYFILQAGFDKNNNSNYGLFNAMDKNGCFGKPLIIQTKKENKNNIISYFDDSNKCLISLKLKSDTKEVEVTTLKSANGTGQKTIDCINDAYTNHGWISVWAFVQSVFIPQTAVLIAADCALHSITD